ncbi:9628_t:CDS:2, partial [Scutellospora calospora]
ICGLLDFLNHGDSAVLNQDILPDVVLKFDFARDILQLIDKANIKKPIIGIGHSVGGHSMLLAEILRPGTFTSILAIEPIMKPNLVKEMNPLKELDIKRRRDRWPDREAAYASFITKKFFQSWDPEVLNLYIQYGLCELPSGEVILKCSKIQEFNSFYSDTSSSITLFHRISEIQCPILFVAGDKSNFESKELSLLNASQCKHNELIFVDAGHLVPMEKPIQV